MIEGIARSMDIGATLQEYNNSQSGQEADLRALSADFYAISDDLRRAIAQITEQEKILINDEILAKANAMLNVSLANLPALLGETENNVKA